jgi:hypothetical protein
MSNEDKVSNSTLILELKTEEPIRKLSDSNENGTTITMLREESKDVLDPFEPFSDIPNEETESSRVVTVRSILIGCILGSLVNASNLYLGKHPPIFHAHLKLTLDLEN